LFQPRFAPLVEAGTKTTTIRKAPKRAIRAGDVLDLRTWIGKPYRSKQRKLRMATCTSVKPIEIDQFHGLVWLGEGFGQTLLTKRQADRLARGDGFLDRADMAVWFERTHGLPFTGVLIEWRT
jgi:hypothetical protein